MKNFRVEITSCYISTHKFKRIQIFRMNPAGVTFRLFASKLGGQATPVRFASSATFETHDYKLHHLTEPPPKKATVTKDEALDYYRKMQVWIYYGRGGLNPYLHRELRPLGPPTPLHRRILTCPNFSDYPPIRN